MGLYGRYILPKVIHFTCSLEPTMRQRQKVVPLASGRVLEIGIGSGLNLPFYDASKVSGVWGVDPYPEMMKLAREAARSAEFPIEFIEASADRIPLDTASIDSIVVTYTLCSIPETEPVFREMARLLKPGCPLIFCEHGAAPDATVRMWQDTLNPIWKRLGGGCQLNRDIPTLIAEGGFAMTDMKTMYIPGWRPACFNYWGTAVGK